MIPRTFPSTYETTNGTSRMVVYFITDLTGLDRWIDYIPVKFAQLESQEDNTYNNNGVHLVDPLSSTSGKQAWVDYIPVYADPNAEDAWYVSAQGYIPVGFSVAPTLSLDFTSASETLDSRITFSRGSSATRFNSSGVLETVSSNVARFDYDPVTLAPKGLLIEEQRTNLLTYSEQFANAAWAKTNATVTANTIVAPDGTLTGDKLIPNNTVTSAYIIQNTSIVSGTTYTYSVYAKAAEFTELRLLGQPAGFGSNQTGVYNLSTGVASVSSGTPIVSMTSVGNGWYRCVLTVTATATTSSGAQIRITTTGNGTSGIYIWGAQLEAGAFPTSYIPTTTAQVTRAADVATMTGTNFSSWYNQNEGTLFSEASTYDVSTGKIGFAITDGGTSNRIHNGHGANPKIFIATGGATQLTASIPSVTFANNVPSKVILGYANNNGNGAANGTVGSDDTALTVPLVTQANIGNLTSTNSVLNGHVKRVSYYPVRLTNAQLQALTA